MESTIDRKRRYDAKRAASQPWRQWYRGPEWRALRAERLRIEPFCRFCAKHGIRTRATVAHHVDAHRGRRELFFNQRNLASACKPCHDSAASSAERLGYSTEIGADGLPIDPRHPFFT